MRRWAGWRGRTEPGVSNTHGWFLLLCRATTRASTGPPTAWPARCSAARRVSEPLHGQHNTRRRERRFGVCTCRLAGCLWPPSRPPALPAAHPRACGTDYICQGTQGASTPCVLDPAKKPECTQASSPRPLSNAAQHWPGLALAPLRRNLRSLYCPSLHAPPCTACRPTTPAWTTRPGCAWPARLCRAPTVSQRWRASPSRLRPLLSRLGSAWASARSWPACHLLLPACKLRAPPHPSPYRGHHSTHSTPPHPIPPPSRLWLRGRRGRRILRGH